MSLITWSDFLSVEIAEIDEQHKNLLQLINSLDDHMQKGDANHIMAKVFDRIVEFIGTHFTTEEYLMKQHGYPCSSAHLLEHQEFATKAIDLQNRLNSGHAEITTETMAFLQDWLYQHLLGTDRLLGEHLRAINAGELSQISL